MQCGGPGLARVLHIRGMWALHFSPHSSITDVTGMEEEGGMKCKWVCISQTLNAWILSQYLYCKVVIASKLLLENPLNM